MCLQTPPCGESSLREQAAYHNKEFDLTSVCQWALNDTRLTKQGLWGFLVKRLSSSNQTLKRKIRKSGEDEKHFFQTTDNLGRNEAGGRLDGPLGSLSHRIAWIETESSGQGWERSQNPHSGTSDAGGQAKRKRSIAGKTGWGIETGEVGG
jgi:hypothetical protein